MPPNFGHRNAFSKRVGEVGADGSPIATQFSYYPNAEPKPVLLPEGVAVTEAQMQAESMVEIDGRMGITEDTVDQPWQSWWMMTQKERTIYDEIAAGVRDPYPTPDGLPPGSDNGDAPIEDEPTPEPFNNGFPRIDGPTPQQEPQQQEQPQGMTIPMDVASLVEMQSQLMLARITPIIEMQEMVITSQAILLSGLLDPESPQHQIMEMWMSKLEALRATSMGGSDEREPEADGKVGI